MSPAENPPAKQSPSDQATGDEATGVGYQGELPTANQQRDAIARLFAQHDRWLYCYLVTLLGSPAQAEEVFQEVCVVLWREHEKFQLDTERPSQDFVKWVAVIAHNQVHNFRRQQKRAGFRLNDVAIDRLAAQAVDRANLFDYRRDALRQCLGKLPEQDRHLVGLCYDGDSESFKTVAERLDRPVNTIYKALNRIRRVLHECIDRTLSAERLS